MFRISHQSLLCFSTYEVLDGKIFGPPPKTATPLILCAQTDRLTELSGYRLWADILDSGPRLPWRVPRDPKTAADEVTRQDEITWFHFVLLHQSLWLCPSESTRVFASCGLVIKPDPHRSLPEVNCGQLSGRIGTNRGCQGFPVDFRWPLGPTTTRPHRLERRVIIGCGGHH